LVAKDTVEEKIIQLQDKKRELFNQIMSGVPTNMDELSEDDFEFILRNDKTD
jgi:SNF2 family DNA or RNA helicase